MRLLAYKYMYSAKICTRATGRQYRFRVNNIHWISVTGVNASSSCLVAAEKPPKMAVKWASASGKPAEES